ncbi:MAG: PDZ domain-containing protein [Firmicutes bacterium]|nr:PDZ domain-containing protein [Bacillota bacterium]
MKKYIITFLVVFLFPIYVLAYSNKVILGGQNLGIAIESDGILVVGFYKVNNTLNNSKLSVGDYIIKVNDDKVNTVDDLINSIENNVKDNKVNITYRHNNSIKDTILNLEYNNGIYKSGLYVKDSLKGLGTLTYIDPESKIYGCLGHEIIDSNTNSKVEVRSGNIFKANVTSITRSSDGSPGSKNAKFIEDKIYGNINKNVEEGIYGTYSGQIDNDNLIEINTLDNVNLGEAYIYTSLDDNTVKSYKINILRKYNKSKIKNFYFEVVDNELLNKTGGIIQGMSGSPIVQNNKLIGAVTHVSVDSVKNGYGISIINMLETGEK